MELIPTSGGFTLSKEEADKIFQNYDWSSETLVNNKDLYISSEAIEDIQACQMKTQEEVDVYFSKYYPEFVLLPPIKVKLLNEDAKMPTKAHDSDAGWDLYAAEDIDIPNGLRKTVKTGVTMAIPDGYVGLIWPRSGLSVKFGVDSNVGALACF